MVQQLGALAALAEVQFSVPIWQLTTPITPVLGDLTQPSGLWAHVMYIYAGKTFMQIKVNLKKN